MRGIAAVALATLAGATQIPNRYDAQATNFYKYEDGTDIRLEGVCSYSDQKIECWDPSGAPNPTLSSQITSFYVGNNQDVTFGFQKKNRLIAFSRSGSRYSMNMMLPQQGYVQTNQLNNPVGDRILCWGILKAEPSQKLGRLIVNAYGTSEAKSDRIPFKEGSSVSFGGVSITLGAAIVARPEQPGPSQNHWPMPTPLGPGKHWTYFDEVKSSDANPPSITYQLFDKSGEPILYVDRNGKPVSELTYVKDAESAPGQNSPSPFFPQPLASTKYARATIDPRITGGVSELLCNVNPDQVGYISASVTRNHSILFTDIPLDPSH